MYGYIPQPQYQNNYNYGQQPPYAQASIYNNARPPYNYQNPANNYNNYNNNQGKVISYQPLKLSCALDQSNYSSYNKNFIKKFLISDYLENKEAKVYFQNKLFVIEHTLPIIFSNKTFKVTMLIHIPMYFPEGQPEFYLQKKPNVGLNKSYLDGRINQETFLINIDRFGRYDPSRNNIKEIINNIINDFNKDFPIYKENKKNAPSYGAQDIYGKYNINKNTANEVIIESDSFTDEQFLNFIRTQVKDKVREKYDKFNKKFNFEQNHKELENLNGMLKMKSGSNNSNINNSPLVQEMEKLKQIKDDISSIENNLQQEIHHLQNENKSALEKCDELIKIRDQKDMEYVVMKKTIEDYLVFLKKGFEKKAVSLEDMINKTSSLSMELFSIDYLRKQRKNNYY